MIKKTLLTTLLILSISGCTDKPVSCTDSKFKKLAQDAYIQQTMKKLSDALIEQIGEYNENDKNIALERFKNNTFLKTFEFENIKELSRDDKQNSAVCEGTMNFDTYEGTFSYKIEYGIQLQGRETSLNMISQ